MFAPILLAAQILVCRQRQDVVRVLLVHQRVLENRLADYHGRLFAELSLVEVLLVELLCD